MRECGTLCEACPRAGREAMRDRMYYGYFVDCNGTPIIVSDAVAHAADARISPAAVRDCRAAR